MPCCPLSLSSPNFHTARDKSTASESLPQVQQRKHWMWYRFSMAWQADSHPCICFLQWWQIPEENNEIQKIRSSEVRRQEGLPENKKQKNQKKKNKKWRLWVARFDTIKPVCKQQTIMIWFFSTFSNSGLKWIDTNTSSHLCSWLAFSDCTWLFVQFAHFININKGFEINSWPESEGCSLLIVL